MTAGRKRMVMVHATHRDLNIDLNMDHTYGL